MYDCKTVFVTIVRDTLLPETLYSFFGTSRRGGGEPVADNGHRDYTHRPEAAHVMGFKRRGPIGLCHAFLFWTYGYIPVIPTTLDLGGVWRHWVTSSDKNQIANVGDLTTDSDASSSEAWNEIVNVVNGNL
jgi:hypothetical protein